MALKQAKIFTVTSVKGGTGKTTTTLNLAGIFEKMGLNVLIIDLDLYAGGVALSLKLEQKKDLFNAIDDLNNNRFQNIEDYIEKYDEFIDCISAPKDPRYASKINSKYLQIIFAKVKPKYDIILIDMNHNLSENNLVTMDESDQILYVITNDPVDLKNMRTMVTIYQDMDRTNYKIILNEASDRQKNYFTRYDIKNILKTSVDYTIPSSFYIKDIDKYVLDGKVVTLDSRIRKSKKKGILHLEKIADSLLKEKRKK